jgi:RNA polymerase sigma-70 factor (ECF subfamily)
MDGMRGSMATQDPTGMLVRRAQDGDRSAFEELVERYRARLERQIRARMGTKVRSRLEPEDILQETLTCMMESIAKFRWRGEESFYSWLGSIAEHLIWNESQKRHGDELRLAKDLPASDVSPSKGLRRDERFERLEKALGSLTDDQRKAVLLARVEGLKVKEIAVRMNRTPDAVGKLLAHAVLQLKKSFGSTESLSLPYRMLGEKAGGDGE